MNLVPCPACQTSVSPKAVSCPKCGHPLSENVGATTGISMGAGTPGIVLASFGWGWEYRSKLNIFGIPLVHIASGYDHKTQTKRIARGIIAIGDIAVGVFAMGGLSLGIVSLGGLALGALALGGLAIGGAAVGGMAVGYVAVGGGAFGYYAVGGGAFGKHTIGPLRQDPEAIRFFLETLGIDLSQFRSGAFGNR